MYPHLRTTIGLLCLAALTPLGFAQNTGSTASRTAPVQQWVWSAEPLGATDHLYLRHNFRLVDLPTQGRLLVSARGAFRLYVNGTAVVTHAGSRTPGEADVTKLLTRGRNVIAVECTGNNGAQGAITWELNMRSADRRVLVVRSRRTVKTSREAPTGWNLPGYDDTRWPVARELGPSSAPAPGAAASTTKPAAPATPVRPAPRPTQPNPAAPAARPSATRDDASRLVRVWSVPTSYGRQTAVGDRMFLSAAMPGAADLPLLASGGFTLLQSSSDPLGTEQTSSGAWDFRRAISERQAAAASGFDWAYGPHFAFPPSWYRARESYTHITCLEHGQPAAAFSPWDPAFGSALRDGYQKVADNLGKRSGSVGLAAVDLGVHGDLGAAGLLSGVWMSTPALRDIWRARFGDTHDHVGWWCGDPLARNAFRSAMVRKYGDLEQLNTAWQTHYDRPEDILMPSSPAQVSRRFWLDFVTWYQGSVGNVAGFVCKTARADLPDMLLTLPLGYADEDPRYGADVSLLTSIAARERVAVRATQGGLLPFAANQAGLFGHIASAARFYRVPLWVDTAGVVTNDRVPDRLFEAASQGAAGYGELAQNVKTARETYFRQGRYLQRQRPVTDVAMFYPTTSHLLHPDQPVPPIFTRGCTEIRDLLNYDVVDERMVRDGALDGYRVLVLWEGAVVEQATLDKIRDWVDAGGVLVAYDFGKIENVEGDRHSFADLFSYAGRLAPAGEKLRFTATGPASRRYHIDVTRPESASFLAGDWSAPSTVAGRTHRFTGARSEVRLPMEPERDYVITISAGAPGSSAGEQHQVLLNGRYLGLISGAQETIYRFQVPHGTHGAGNVATLAFASRGGRVEGAPQGALVSYVEVGPPEPLPITHEPGLPNGRFEVDIDLQRLRTDWAHAYGRGWTVYYPAQRKQLNSYYEVIRYLTYHLSDLDATKHNAIAADDAWDGLYATVCTDRVIYYNATAAPITRTVVLSPEAFGAYPDVKVPTEFTHTVTVEPHGLTTVYFGAAPQELLLQCERFTTLGSLTPATGAEFSPGRGATQVLIPANGQISTRFECTVPGLYRVYYRVRRRNAEAAAEVAMDGRAITPSGASSRRGLTAPLTRLAGTVNLTEGVHTLTLRPRKGEDIRADFVLLTNDATIEGYRFAPR